MLRRLTELIRGLETRGGYSRALQAARMSLSLSTLQEQTIMARQTISYYRQPSSGF